MALGQSPAANRVPADTTRERFRQTKDGESRLQRFTNAREGALLSVLLDAGGAQASETMLVDRCLPGEEFLDREGIAVAGFVER